MISDLFLPILIRRKSERIRMLVFGVDPGLTTTGYALLEEANGKVTAKLYGTIAPPKGKPLADRLEYLFEKYGYTQRFVTGCDGDRGHVSSQEF